MLALREPRPLAIVPSWIEAHCVVPDGFRAGEPLRLYDYQLLALANHYLVRGDAIWVPENPILGPAFVHARSELVGPQKMGKNPLGAAWICGEAEGPVLFAGWAGKGDGYACSDSGCGCGWEYSYDIGEPMGMPWPTPLIQITAYSEDQTDNTYDVLRPMIQKGPLNDLIPKTGETFIRLRGPDDQARIEVVTSSEQSRLGNRATAILQDQVEQYWASNGMEKLADAQYRNLSGTGGRAFLLANMWDPSQHSVAQRESAIDGVYFQTIPWPKVDGKVLDFMDPDERRRGLEVVYPLDVRREGGGHVDLNSIEPEAIKIAAHDPPQARRFFGNEEVEGQGKAFDLATFIKRRVTRSKVVPPGALIVLGVDGSIRWDHFPIIATEVASGYQWPLHIWTPGGPGKEVPMAEVDRVLDEAYETWDVWRQYTDPPYIEGWLANWAGRFGEKRVLAWDTRRPKAMALAIRAWNEAITRGEMSHCAEGDRWCELFTAHIGNAVRRDTNYRDDEGPLWTVEKERDGSPLKIDSGPAAVLSWEARMDAIAGGALNQAPTPSAYARYHSLTGDEDLGEDDVGDDSEIAGPFVDELAPAEFSDVDEEEMVTT